MDVAGETLNADIEATRSDPTLQREHVAALVRLGTLEQKLGRYSEADRLISEAIVIVDRHPGAEHPTLGPALNELSRLHLRQSDHARAEPILERLLLIARAKGDRHPDVATALSGLAVAKRGLGDEAGAEQLYRQALRIREDVLAPDHMAIVITLEQLSETCAARGKIAEALVHLQRALLRRERALGADHSTVHALHARLIDLHRRHIESIAAAAERPFVAQTSRAELAPAPSVPPEVAPPLPTPRVPTPWHGVELVSPTADTAALFAQTQIIPVVDISPSTMRGRRWSDTRTIRFASAAAAVVVLTVAGFGFRSIGRSETERAPSGAAPHNAILTPASSAGSYAAAASGPEATPSGSRTTPTPTATQSAPDAHSAAAGLSIALPSFRRLVVPKIAVPSVDSLVRAATKLGRDAEPDPIVAGGGVLSAARNDDATVTPPVLITAPTLRFPDELRAQRVEGEVVVQLRVNEKGRVDPSSMRVMQSEHELFTAAVRNALSSFRFEPAHTPAPGSKPQSAWVQFRARFTARN